MTLRECDYQIARHLFGWKHLQFTRTSGSRFVMLMAPDDIPEHIRSMNPVEVESGDEDNAREYTTDANASKRVRQKLAERFHGFNLSKSPHEVNTAKPYCFQVFTSNLNDADVTGPYAETEELAVALCALKSIGMDVEVEA